MSSNLIRVSQRGDGDCLSIGEALDIAKKYEGEAVDILVSEGIYREKLTVSQSDISLIGLGDVLITYGDYARELMPDGEKRGTFRTATFMVDADGFTARNISFENSAGPGEKVGQALAVYADGDRLVFDNCRLFGWQDTLFTAPLPPAAIEKNGFRGPKEFAPRKMGRHLYLNCRIQGEVDFIFGSARVWFEGCEIVSLETGREINGYVTAASTPEGEKYGYVFNNCRFIGECREKSVYLGRPWRDYAKVVIMKSELGAHILPSGWHDWGKPNAREASFFREYKNSGKGACAQREAWAGELSNAEAAEYSPETVLGDWVREFLPSCR